MIDMLLAAIVAHSEPPRVAETIVVTAERIEQPLVESTAAVTVLRRRDLERTTAKTLGDALALVPGLQLIDVNPGAPPMIASRGFFGAGEVEYLQLLVDGMPLADVESGLGDWRAIPIDDVERIEVLRGPGSSLFGDAAMGGVVQVFRKPSTYLSASLASFATSRWTGAYATPAFSASAGQTRSDGFREHSASRESFANVTFERARLRATLDATDRDRDDPGPLGAEELYRQDRESSRRVHAALRYRGALDVLVHAHHRDGTQTRTFLLTPDFGDRATRDVTASAFGTTITRTTKHAVLGIDAARESLESRYGNVAGDGTRLAGAAFVSGEWRITPNVRLAAGARYDAISDAFESASADDRAFSPRIGASFDLGEANVYVQLARSFKAPAFDQRFDQRTFGPITISNPALRAQHANNIEAGVRGEEWEVCAYHMTVDDEIDFDVRTFRYGNIGRSRHDGIEASWSRAPLRLGYAWTRVSKLDGDDRGKQLKNIAEHVIRAGVDAGLVHVDATYSANRWLDDANLVPLDDALVVDARVAKTFRALSAALEATNLFDRSYAPLGFLAGDQPFYYPAARRSIGVTLAWRGGHS